MPANPAVPEPRRKRKSTVSAWSERVWPVAMRSTVPACDQPLEKLQARRARRLFQIVARLAAERGYVGLLQFEGQIRARRPSRATNPASRRDSSPRSL